MPPGTKRPTEQLALLRLSNDHQEKRKGRGRQGAGRTGGEEEGAHCSLPTAPRAAPGRGENKALVSSLAVATAAFPHRPRALGFCRAHGAREKVTQIKRDEKKTFRGTCVLLFPLSYPTHRAW